MEEHEEMTTDGQQIKQEYSTDRKLLEKQIVTLEARQQEIQYYIATIHQGIQNLEQLIVQEQAQAQPKFDKIKNYRVAISKNVQLQSELYSTYKSFEDVKFKYYKQITDQNLRVQQLIAIDLKKANSQYETLQDANFMDVMGSLMNMMKDGSKEQVTEETRQELLQSPDYEM